MKNVFLLSISLLVLAACDAPPPPPSAETPVPSTAPIFDSNVTAQQAISAGGAGATFTPNYNGGIAENPNQIKLNDYTQAQQKVDRDIYAQQQSTIADNRWEAGYIAVPEAYSVNVTTYARQAKNAVGESVFPRSGKKGSCKYSSAYDAQRVFLENGGPQQDTLGLDPDGDGYACAFNPEPYRGL